MISTETSLKRKFLEVRAHTEKICEPLETEDYVVQPIVDVSPPKWHLAHTTWFFETFILKKYVEDYKEFHPQFGFLFNSYYVGAGERLFRPDRGFMTRPTVRAIMNYREYVNEEMTKFLNKEPNLEVSSLIQLGINHEQQHQELLLYDIKYILGNNPMFPEYLPIITTPDPVIHPNEIMKVDEGVYDVGFEGKGFHFDNEEDRHKVYLNAFGVMDRLITNEEYVAFMEDGGYEDFRLWFMEAHEWVKENKIKAPLYWHNINGLWHRYALRGGLKPVDPKAPVTHISMYEADAFSKWSGKRLPTEFEWEVAAGLYGQKDKGNYADSGNYEPVAVNKENNQLFGDVWEWTSSAYLPYPGYKAPKGAVGEYNGKFMVNQMVLRGGSCATSADHIRHTYRNFFHPNMRWLFSGIRLAESL